MNIYEIGKYCKLCSIKESALIQMMVLPERVKPETNFLTALYQNTRTRAKTLKNNDYLCGACKRDLKVVNLFRKQCVSSVELLNQIHTKINDCHQVLIEDKLINVGIFNFQSESFVCPTNVEDKRDDPDEILIEELLEEEETEVEIKDIIVPDQIYNAEVMEVEMKADPTIRVEEQFVEEECEEWLDDGGGSGGDIIKHEVQEVTIFQLENDAETLIEHVTEPKPLAGPYVCDLCDTVYVKKATLDVHKFKVHNISLPQRRIRPKHENFYDIYYGVDLTKTCEYCFEEFENPDEMTAHIAANHPDPAKYTCRECKNLFKTKNSLRNHYSHIHAGVQRPKQEFGCSYCDRVFSQKTSLISHEEVVHMGIKGKFVCDICGHKANAKSDLTRHKHRHTKHKPHACTYEGCDRRFLTTTELRSHITHLHLETKPYACDMCLLRFAVKSSLEAHKREHLGIRPFLCALCNKGFARKTNRDAHQKTHTKTKDEKCLICGRMFLYPKQLRMHQKRVHQENRPLKCLYCPNLFEQAGPLKRHITIDHPEIKKTMSEEEFRTVIAEALRIHHQSEGDGDGSDEDYEGALNEEFINEDEDSGEVEGEEQEESEEAEIEEIIVQEQ